jgi:hypothetical protein
VARLVHTSYSRRWVAAVGPSFGKAQVSFDGQVPTTLDFYRATPGWRVIGYEMGGSAPGSHSLTVKVLGTKSAASTGTRVVVDAFALY